MTDPDRRKFAPIIFPHFYYSDVEPKPVEKKTIDYKAAYELQRLDSMRLAQMGMKLIDALSAYTTEPITSELAKAKADLGKLILEM